MATNPSSPPGSPLDDRVLVWAPPRDARLTCGVLEEAAVLCYACRSWDDVSRQWARGAGALLFASEYLTGSVQDELRAMLLREPAWSDPAIIVVSSGEDADQDAAITVLGNVSVLQRPLPLSHLRTTVRGSLRARRRQYLVRDLLSQKDAAERRKDEFLAMLAHELRNPLAPIRTGLQILRMTPAPETARDTHEMMERQLVNVTRLIDDLLDVSRITQRKITLRKELLDLRSCVEQAMAAVTALAARRRITITADLPAAPVVVNADRVRVEQMLGNLLNNAAKFSQPGGRVMVTVAPAGPTAVVRIKDHGVGIARGQLDHVFELFAQSPRPIDRTQGGLGIGLTVVKLLAELHGGSVELFSAGEGQGTEGVLTLPASGGADAVADEEPRRPASGAARRVLVIDDNRDHAETLRLYLEQLGHHVSVAFDGHTGVAAARQAVPEVVICDIGLPGIDGYEVARRMSAGGDGSTCLLIALTGYGEPADREKSRVAGFHVHLTKPADPVEIAALISTAAARSCARSPSPLSGS